MSDPAVTFQETIVDESRVVCAAFTPNKQNKLAMQASPLDPKIGKTLFFSFKFIASLFHFLILSLFLVAAAELGQLTSENAADSLEKIFGWDLLAAQGLWAFGPPAVHSRFDNHLSGTNTLVDETLTDEYSEEFTHLQSIRGHVVQGFNWGCKEGPLTEEPMRGINFRVSLDGFFLLRIFSRRVLMFFSQKLVNATVSTEPFQRGGGQIIPTTRRVLYSAMLTASPRLMEPIYRVEVQW